MAYNVVINCVGNRKDFLSDSSIKEYLKRIENFSKLELNFVKPVHDTNKNEIINKESEKMYRFMRENYFNIALSEEGREFDSIAFSKELNTGFETKRGVSFIIGGAFGLSQDLKKKCDIVLSLSKFTFSYKLAFLVLSEQIYRAFTILKGHPYHKA